MERTLIFQDLNKIAVWQDELPWQPFHKRVEIYRLYGNGEDGAAAALLRYQPGAKVPRHGHPGFEHVLVLSGSQTDHNGEHIAGTLVINPPDSNHTVVSDRGCIVLVIWEKPVFIWP